MNSLTAFLLQIWCHFTDILSVTVNQRFFIAIVILLVTFQPSCAIRTYEFVVLHSFEKLLAASDVNIFGTGFVNFSYTCKKIVYVVKYLVTATHLTLRSYHVGFRQR